MKNMQVDIVSPWAESFYYDDHQRDYSRSRCNQENCFPMLDARPSWRRSKELAFNSNTRVHINTAYNVFDE